MFLHRQSTGGVAEFGAASSAESRRGHIVPGGNPRLAATIALITSKEACRDSVNILQYQKQYSMGQQRPSEALVSASNETVSEWLYHSHLGFETASLRSLHKRFRVAAPLVF